MSTQNGGTHAEDKALDTQQDAAEVNGTFDVDAGGMEDVDEGAESGGGDGGAAADAPAAADGSADANVNGVSPADGQPASDGPATDEPAADAPASAATVTETVPLVFRAESDELGVPKGSGLAVETLGLQAAQDELAWLEGGKGVLDRARKEHHEAAVSAQDRIDAIERDVAEKADVLHKINARLHRDVNGRIDAIRNHITALQIAAAKAAADKAAQPSIETTAQTPAQTPAQTAAPAGSGSQSQAKTDAKTEANPGNKGQTRKERRSANAAERAGK